MAEPLQEDIEFLEHHGVKGQKWGVRRAAKKMARADKKFERKAGSLKTAIAVHNAAAKRFNEVDLPKINNKPKYKDQNFLKDSPIRRQYYKEHQDAFLANLEIAAQNMGTNASGTRRYSILEGSDGSWAVRTTEVNHADNFEMIVKPKFDSSGHIISLVVVNDAIEQSAFDIGEFLKHHGVKGQKWGVRKSRRAKARANSERNRPINKAKKLSDDDLKRAIQRMDLEKRYVELANATSTTAGKRYANDILRSSGKSAAGAVVGGVAGRVVKSVLKP